ncbi:Acetolactate synthase large subunit [Candidatus Hepatincola sp. Pdp]
MSTAKLQNASDLFIKALENEGVEVVYGVPGEENLAFLEALRKSKIKLILNRHEQAAAFMAATYGRITGKTGVAIATLGPGATNFTTAAAYAKLGGFPLLLITGQKPIKQSKQGQFQIIDVVSMMRPLTKYTKQIVDVNMVCTTVREAVRISQEEKPGCVHIEFPEDVSAELITPNTKGILNISSVSYPCDNLQGIDEASAMIKAATLPLVLIGAAGNRHNAYKEITQFINTTELPFFNTQMGKGIVAENSPHFIGTAALSAGDYLHDAIKKADLIINIGHDVIEKPAYFPHENLKTIHISYTSAMVDNIYYPHLECIGDIASILKALGAKIGKCSKDFSAVYKVKEFLQKHLSEHNTDNSFPIKPQRLVNDINKIMAKDGTVCLDNGVYKLWFARNYTTQLPNTLLLDNALATMGAGLPSAMEVARLNPKNKVLAVVGDGGFMMNSQELETAVRLKLNLVVLIINDNSYGMIRWKQNAMGLEDYGLQFHNPNFVKYAESYGIKGHMLTKTEEFSNLLTKCFKEGGVHLIETPIDYLENKKVLTDELKKHKGLI